ncbi:glycosyltransferase family A protein [uncultured Anaerococcus sp.]|uniref:glycosyltransferase family 2 protein n=1 Tax=uncultured Anaerococcus sp. TaxID=293428 RepID=UPI00288A2A8B|nr:glycosyltransferase family A protein [uncultured Anaerococcus sp.]
MGKGRDYKEAMRVEVLISAMNVEDINFYKKFNLECDALIINQAGKNSYQEVYDDGKKIRMITTDTRGLAISRNLALLNSTADIVVFADDDEVFEKGYLQRIKDGFIEYPDVDFFVFKTIVYQEGKEIVKVQEDKDLSFYNCLRYGSVHFVFRREALARANLYLPILFGAGTSRGSGEDSIFILSALRKGLRVRTNTSLIAKVYNDDSTWFKGFDEKYFYDKGALARALFPRFYKFYIRYFLYSHPEMLREIKKERAREMMLKGARDFGGYNGK